MCSIHWEPAITLPIKLNSIHNVKESTLTLYKILMETPLFPTVTAHAKFYYFEAFNE